MNFIFILLETAFCVGSWILLKAGGQPLSFQGSIEISDNFYRGKEIKDWTEEGENTKVGKENDYEKTSKTHKNWWHSSLE